MRAILFVTVIAAAVAAHADDLEKTAPRAPGFPFPASEASRYRAEHAKWAGLPDEFTNSLGMTFVLVPPGTYWMGSPDDEPGRNPGGYDEGPRHLVSISKPFYLGKHEVTFAQFKRFVDATGHVTDGERTGGGNAHDSRGEWKHRPGTNWREPGFAGPFQQQDDLPVVHVSHADATSFCHWLAEQPRGKAALLLTAAGRLGLNEPILRFGLPTEAQWEWACRAGSGERFWWGADEDTSGKLANVGDRALQRVHPEWPRIVMPMDDGRAFLAPVGSYQANGFGLHDMLGNVWEFCSTHYGPYPHDPVTDPSVGDKQRGFAVRGGGWSNAPRDVRCATRNADPPHFCHSNLGFRVAIVLAEQKQPTADDVLDGVRDFFKATARPDGSFQNGIDPDYRGMSDSAYSDLAAVTYAVTLHKTFGWKLPSEEQTAAFLLSRQKPSGEFVNVAGTVKPESAEGKTYNTTQALVALRALGVKPKYNPLPVFEDILKEDYKELPAYTTSFFPLAYLCAGKPIPDKADRGVRALMIQDRTGYMHDHIAATFHASHYYHLVGEPTPKSPAMVARILSDQKDDGSWLLNMPSRDRHGTFDAVFTLHHEGHGRADCQAAIQRAARWALSCRNDDGGFGHYPGSTSDVDANYFQIGTLVMAGFLQPVDPLPADPHLLSWGHLMPIHKNPSSREVLAVHLDGWVGAVAFSNDGKRVIAASADHSARVWDIDGGRERFQVRADGYVSALSVSPTTDLFATGSYGHTAAIWNLRTGVKQHDLKAHRGAVLAVAFHPNGKTLATSGIDSAVILWDVTSGNRIKTLLGHKSWVNSLAYSPDGEQLFSGSSDGTVRVWNAAEDKPPRVLDATSAEVRSIAVSRDGRWLAAGIRYGQIKVWDRKTWQEHMSFKGHESDVWAVGFTPDSTTLASGNGDWNRPGHVKLWDITSGRQTDSLQHTGEVLSLAVSPDGCYLAAGGGDKSLRVWELKK